MQPTTMVCSHVLPSPDPLVDRISKQLGELPAGPIPPRSPADGPCIWRVPPAIRDHESEAYEPRLVSIGPFHRGKQCLLPMEQVKISYLRDLLGRSHDNRLDQYVRAVRLCEQRAREQYSQPFDFNRDEFVEMMVIDGCFVIEYFIKRAFKQTAETTLLSGNRWGFAHLRRDLMLLENQVPFFVLVKLFELSRIPFTGSRKEPLDLVELSLRFLDVKLPMEEQPPAHQVLHLLHLYHLCLDPRRVEEERSYSFGRLLLYPLETAASFASLIFFGLLYLVLIRKWPFVTPKKDSSVPRTINCAAELVEAGIQFKKKGSYKDKVSSFLKLSFVDGTLEIPFLKVEESTSSKLRNLIALEQCCPHVGDYCTSYAIFVDNVINTESDIAILRSSDIIESKLGSDAEVADMFNKLCKGTHIKYDGHANASLFKAVKEYSDFAHHRWRAALVHKYFSTPLTAVTLVAVCVLLLLSATQTYFTVFPKS
ncbi:hypothetical protein Taro_026511 [Colocasia esculenta]|uniref:Uncharacterized protein n=1 Tax=Colocasia esculenta TaxID=4460 RepID=A0A843VRI1_COLES|nr:hypothetical protein [Colocasia esculenta]